MKKKVDDITLISIIILTLMTTVILTQILLIINTKLQTISLKNRFLNLMLLLLFCVCVCDLLAQPNKCQSVSKNQLNHFNLNSVKSLALCVCVCVCECMLIYLMIEQFMKKIFTLNILITILNHNFAIIDKTTTVYIIQ